MDATEVRGRGGIGVKGRVRVAVLTVPLAPEPRSSPISSSSRLRRVGAGCGASVGIRLGVGAGVGARVGAGVRVAAHLCTSITVCTLPAGCGVGAVFALMPRLFNWKSAKLNVPDCESMNESLFSCDHLRTEHAAG